MTLPFLMADESSGGFGALFTALGINWSSLLFNMAAFLIVAWVLGKFVYPSLIKALDDKKGELEAAARQEREAAVKLEEATKRADKVVGQARREADEILATAKADATAQIETARTKATEQGERLVAEAREQLSRDVLTARRELKAETARLVAQATEAVLNEKLDSAHDRELIGRVLETK